ncbi:type II toxin-antitoxin system CcdA family antitoxin [Streptomyces similanensis]|uniref:Toxin-antitoxin system HicB family antitoxin n=1 Tax=Streptomyces similanensis TaxID=1274988 RepID=A0ABP9L786_9ACTN
MTTRNSTRERTSITLPPDLMRRAKLAGGDNLSAYVEIALREKLLSDAMREVARLHAMDPMDDVLDAAEADTEAAA